MKELQEQRDALLADIEGILDAAASEKRGLTDEEKTSVAEKRAEVKGLRQLMQERALAAAERDEILPELREAREAIETPEAKRDSVPHGEGRTNERDPVYHRRSNHSFYADTVRAAKGDRAAFERLEKMRVYNEQELKKRDLYDNATDGAEALVPLYQQDRFEKYRTNLAIASGLTKQEVIPVQGESITIPFQTGAAAVAAVTQATPLNALQETDAQFDRETVDVVEVAGVQDMSLLLQERGNLGASLDAIIGDHLAELLAQDEDERVLASVLANAGVAVTYSATTGTLPGIYPKLADAAQQIIASNKMPPSAIVVNQRRFFKWASELDTTNRPYMVPMSVAQNPLAKGGESGPVAHGFTGYAIHGIPVYIDQNVTTTNNTDQDVVFVADWSKQYTWLGPVQVEVDRSPMFKNSGLTVRARRYFATMTGHRAGAFGKITGTGLATPSFS